MGEKKKTLTTEITVTTEINLSRGYRPMNLKRMASPRNAFLRESIHFIFASERALAG